MGRLQRYRFLITPLVFTAYLFLFSKSTHAVVDLTCSTDNENAPSWLPFFCQFQNVGSLITRVLPNLLILAGVILLIYIIIAGFGIMKNAGSGEETEKGKQAITAALIGFFLIFASYFIIQLVEFIFGVEIFNATLPS